MSKRIIIFLILSCLTLFYFAYDNYKDKKTAQKELISLADKIKQLEQKTESDNKIIEQKEQEKVALENLSTERQEKIDELLKNNDCANQFIPNDISDSMYNRAKSLRKSSDTSKPVK